MVWRKNRSWYYLKWALTALKISVVLHARESIKVCCLSSHSPYPFRSVPFSTSAYYHVFNFIYPKWQHFLSLQCHYEKGNSQIAADYLKKALALPVSSDDVSRTALGRTFFFQSQQSQSFLCRRMFSDHTVMNECFRNNLEILGKLSECSNYSNPKFISSTPCRE